MVMLFTLLKNLLQKLIENWGLITLFCAIILFFMWISRGNDLEIANQQIEELTNNLLKQQKIAEQLTEDKKSIETKLQVALDTINSDDCGKTIVPEYLLKKQKEILGVK